MPTYDEIRPIIDRLATIERKQDEILRRLDAAIGKPKPHLTRMEFAKLSGLSRWTVSRKIEAFEIRTERGRIPYSELQKFAS